MAVPAFSVATLPDRIGGQEVNPRAGYTPFTRAFNLSGQPAASIPCGFSSEGLPVGLHIVGRRREESTVLRASAAFERVRPWAEHRPPVD
jgi:aspartyl-tRNA(Asn)/glutamyl-tRNA(Gln) amidotransferase subunit A